MALPETGTSSVVDDTVRTAIANAVTRTLHEPDLARIEDFWAAEDVRKHLINRHAITDSQLASIRELAMSGVDAAAVSRHLKKMERRSSNHKMWQAQVRVGGSSVSFAAALRMLVDDLAGVGFEARLDEVRAALGRAAERAGIAAPVLSTDLRRARTASLGASLSYLIRLAQSERAVR